MRYLVLAEVLALHRRVIQQTGGSGGIRDLGAAQSAVAQPLATFDGEDLYPTLTDKAAALAYSLVANHPFLDGNKRVGHAAMETFLVLNGHELDCSVEDQEAFWLALASGQRSRSDLIAWLGAHLRASGG